MSAGTVPMPGNPTQRRAGRGEADLANFDAGRWYANLATPTDPAGAIRGQLEVPNP
jgi:CHRD domain